MELSSTIPITIKGRYFFQGSERFLIRGVCYQCHTPSRSENVVNNGHQLRDPIADERIEVLRQDIELFKELNLNAIFVYTVDNTKSHDLCMTALCDAGIYVLLGLPTPTLCISRTAPLETYNATLLDHYFKTVDCFDKYSNVLGVFAGNEIINEMAVTKAAEVVRAVVRDVKKYMRLKSKIVGSRVLPVGYSAAHVMMLMKASAEYFTAGFAEERVDFYAMNNYSWCGPSSLQRSGWDNQIQALSHIRVPLFWSEYGANVVYPKPRIFDEVLALYSAPVTDVLSGGCVYEFHAGANQYGLVDTYPDRSVGRRKDFKNFKANMTKVVESLRTHPPPVVQADEDLSDTWLGQFPEVKPGPRSWWQSTAEIPGSPMDWHAVKERLRDEDWVQVDMGEVNEHPPRQETLAIRTGQDTASALQHEKSTVNLDKGTGAY